MNEKFDLFVEKYISILCGIIACVVSIFTIKYDNAVVLAWLDNTRWFLFAFGVFNFVYFIAVKKTVTMCAVYTDDVILYPALQLLEQHPQEKKRFYRHFDKIKYSSLFVAMITFFYPNLCILYNIYFLFLPISIISMTMGLTAYMFSQIIIVYVILDKFKKYSCNTRNLN